MTTILYFLLFIILSVIGFLITKKLNIFNKGVKSSCKTCGSNNKNNGGSKPNYIRINNNTGPYNYSITKQVDSNKNNEYDKFFWANNEYTNK
jgi:hypothetical protein